MEVHFLAIHCKSLILCPVAFWQISTFCNAFQRFWHNSTLFVYTLSWIFHKPERMCLKVPITDSSTLSLRVAQTLRPLGIIRSMRSYSILADCLQLIWEQEDRLEAVQKEIYEPVAEKHCSDWTAIQSTIAGPHRPPGAPTLPVCRSWRATRWTAAPVLYSSSKCCTTILHAADHFNLFIASSFSSSGMWV